MLYSLGSCVDGRELMEEGVSKRFIEGLVDIIKEHGTVTSASGTVVDANTIEVEAVMVGYMFRTESKLVSSEGDEAIKACYVELSQEEAHARFHTTNVRGCLRTFAIPCESRGVLVLRFTWGIRLIAIADAIYQHGVYTVGYPAYESVTLADRLSIASDSVTVDGQTFTASPYILRRYDVVFFRGMWGHDGGTVTTSDGGVNVYYVIPQSLLSETFVSDYSGNRSKN